MGQTTAKLASIIIINLVKGKIMKYVLKGAGGFWETLGPWGARGGGGGSV